MLLAEELLLLALDPDKGRVPFGKGDHVKPGLCGALLSELVLRQRVTVLDNSAEVVDDGPTGDDLLDEAIRALREDARGRKSLKRQVKAVSRALGPIADRVAGRLVAAGVVGEERGRVAGLIPVTRHPLTDPTAYREVRERLRDWVAHGGAPADARAASLVALLGACRLLAAIADGRAERRRVWRVARAAMKEDPAARAVRAIIEEVEAAAALAVVHG